jgi:tetratricopeptide (TPR) repeat protein
MAARIFSVILMFSLFIQPSRAIEMNDKGPGKLQLLRIKNMMMGGEYAAAWRALRELEATDSTSAELFAMSGECHFYLKNYQDALTRLNRSVELDPNAEPEKYFFLAQTFQQLGKLREAIPVYELYLQKSVKKDENTEEASALLVQCRNALGMMENPVNVKIRNLGTSINSEYPEYNPSISADGSTLIFTSRRRDGEGSAVDPNDGKFFEDIFFSTLDSATGKWTDAELIPGKLNTEGHDANMTLSPDGNMIFVYRNMGIRGSGELFYSKKSKSSGKWSAAQKVEGDINTSYFESSATISPDGKHLFFVSERPRGGFGMGDIYMAKKEGKYGWGSAINLGPVVNDEYDQIGLFMHPDGKTLYFASNSPKSIGGYDIFKTTVDSKGKCTEPVNLGYPINTTGDERFFAVSTDGRTAWFSSDREGSEGDLDIWEIDFSAIIDAENAARKAESAEVGPAISILTGKVIDSNAGEIIETDIEIYSKDNGSKVSVTSDENGEYFITLEGGHTYEIRVNNKDFQPYTYEVFLDKKEKGTFTKEKIIVLDRK